MAGIVLGVRFEFLLLFNTVGLDCLIYGVWIDLVWFIVFKLADLLV